MHNQKKKKKNQGCPVHGEIQCKPILYMFVCTIDHLNYADQN